MPVECESVATNEASAEERQRQFLAMLEDQMRPLGKICWAYADNSHDRDDLLQEIARRLWTAFDKYDSSRKFSTWMFRIALNAAIDFRRRKRRWGRQAVEFADNFDVPADDDPDKRLQVRELRELLDNQNEADRALLLLYLEGHSHREIGEIVGASESNIGTRLHRLKQTMRHSAQRDGE